MQGFQANHASQAFHTGRAKLNCKGWVLGSRFASDCLSNPGSMTPFLGRLGKEIRRAWATAPKSLSNCLS